MARSIAVAAAIIAAVLLLVPLVSCARAAPPNGRPLPYQRKFVAPVIDQLIANLSAQIKDPVLATLFSNCLPNTLDTTVEIFTNSTDPLQIDTYIVTGDIPAMWLRDSTNQVWPYVRYAKEDAALQSLLRGLINRQVKSVLIDPYANAFTSGLHDVLSPNMETDTTSFMGFLGSSVNAMTLNLWERKYELDSLVSVMRLSWYYYEVTGDTSVFDSRWLSAMQLIIQTIEAEQAGSDEGYTYYFNRLTTVPTDTLQWSVGPPGRRCGLSRSPFRPSDDAAIMPYPVAANAYAVVYLTRIAPLIESLNASLASQALSLASEINASLHTYGVFNRGGSSMLAYEVDGFGNGYFMDDANVPSLLSLPYLGWLSSSDPLYLSTRAFVLSSSNPYYFSGSAGAGIGGPHNGLGYVWPISIMMQAFTSNSDAEILNCLALLKSSSAGTGFMHESFWQDDVTQFTRPWFAWANSLFGELMLYIAQTRPYLILR